MKLHLITEALNEYVKYIGRKESMYKWDASKQFRANWNPSSLDFGQMYTDSISKEFVSSWWKDRPRTIIEPVLKMSERNPSHVKQMFQDLLYPRVALDSRISHFQEDCEVGFAPLYNEVDLGLKNHGHEDLEVIFMYLAFNQPEKYPLYRYDALINSLNRIQAKNIPGPYAFDDIVKVHQVIMKIIMRDEKFVDLLQDIFGENYAPNDLMIGQDFMEFSGTKCHK